VCVCVSGSTIKGQACCPCTLCGSLSMTVFKGNKLDVELEMSTWTQSDMVLGGGGTRVSLGGHLGMQALCVCVWGGDFSCEGKQA
jgi:hypothetical protein